MLFSRHEIAEYIQERFEPVWEEVRPVPRVQIDFGNGKKLTRTLHGNISTYVCNPEGKVLDILPGIYEPVTYLNRLENFANLHKAFKRSGARYLASYHHQQVEFIRAEQNTGKPPPQVIDPADFGKRIVESRMKELLMVAKLKEELEASPARSLPRNADELSRWKALTRDTKFNETERRVKIHGHLAAAGEKLLSPDQLTKWLYREVLHSDLDDPYLGLGEVLFANTEK